MSRPERRDGVLVVGGGYAGLHAVRTVERLGINATVIDRTGDHDFVTRLAAVAGGSAPKSDARQPLGRFVRSVEAGSVISVDDGAVELADGRRIEADAVVITAGASPLVDLVPPLMHHAIDLKDLIEIGGLGALRFAPAPVRALIPRLPGPSWPARPAARPATP